VVPGIVPATTSAWTRDPSGRRYSFSYDPLLPDACISAMARSVTDMCSGGVIERQSIAPRSNSSRVRPIMARK